MHDIIPAQVPVTRWTAPEWALASHVEDGAVRHSHGRDLAQLSPDDDATAIPLGVEVAQHDELVVDAGAVRVVRGPAPVVHVGGLWLTLAQAGALGLALVELVELVERCESGPVDPDEPCASCGISRAEHRLAVHAFVGGDR